MAPPSTATAAGATRPARSGKVALAPDNGDYVVTSAWANRSPTQGLTSAEFDPHTLGGLLDRLAGRD